MDSDTFWDTSEASMKKFEKCVLEPELILPDNKYSV